MREGFNFFWQLLLAFLISNVIVGVGIYISGRLTFRDLEDQLQQHPPAWATLWIERLGDYYADQDGWAGIEQMLASYPAGEAWAPWDEDWTLPVMLADAQGRILAAPEMERVGQTLSRREAQVALPITVEDEPVGYVVALFWVPPPDDRTPDAGQPASPPDQLSRLVLGARRPEFFRLALQRLLIAEGVVLVLALGVGVLLSRRISRPLVDFTAATGAIARGDLSVRVPEAYPGELGALGASLNTMASALEHADELRRRMTADVAHELRTPLSVIRGKLEGVLDGVYPATETHLAPILEETELLTHLVEDLRLLALAEAGQLPLELRLLDIRALLRDAQVNFAPQAEENGITLALDLPGDLPKVAADWRRIAQVVRNLLTNALRHTSSGGTVTLSVEAEAASVVVRVQDTGEGIAPEHQPYVFERFWRAEKARSRTGGGSGLGLAIAKQMVDLHGGEIGVESAVGEGAIFWFTLPLVQP